MKNCPCCSHVLLRHIRGHEVYWFCRNCWQNMPMLDEDACYRASKSKVLETNIGVRIGSQQWEMLPAV